MKILIFYQYFGTPAGSWSTRMYELSRRWVNAGHDVTVVTAPYEKSDIKATKFISRQEVDGIKLIIINSSDSNRDTFIKRTFRALLFSIIACKIALTESCDVVIASSGPITVGIPALAAKLIRGKKMVFEIRDLWPMGAIELGKIKNSLLIKICLWFEKYCYKNSSLVVACSVGMETNVKTRFPSTNTLVIPNASDSNLFNNQKSDAIQPPPEFSGKIIFLYAGSLGLIDYGMLMVRAMSKINNSNIQLVLIGEGAERSDLEKEVIRLELKNIHFLGLMPKTEVVQWFKFASASIVTCIHLPILQHCSPNKLFDSFAAGVPVIHNTTGWIKNLVDSERCGISIDPDNEKSLADAINKIAADSEFRNLLSKNSLRLGQTVFNRDLLSKKYLDALEAL